MIRVSSAFLLLCLACGASPAVERFATRPRLLLDAPALSRLRTEVQRPGWKRELYLAARDQSGQNSGEGIKSNADRWVERAIEIPERGGHYHHFFCEEGDRLALPSDQHFAPGPYNCSVCGKSYAGEKYEAALRRMVHSWLSIATLDLALTGRLEGESRYRSKACEILVRYTDRYPGPHTSATEGGIVYQSLDEAMWVIPLAEAYDLIAGDFDEEERHKVEKFLRSVASGLRECGAPWQLGFMAPVSSGRGGIRHWRQGSGELGHRTVQAADSRRVGR